MLWRGRILNEKHGARRRRRAGTAGTLLPLTLTRPGPARPLRRRLTLLDARKSQPPSLAATKKPRRGIGDYVAARRRVAPPWQPANRATSLLGRPASPTSRVSRLTRLAARGLIAHRGAAGGVGLSANSFGLAVSCHLQPPRPPRCVAPRELDEQLAECAAEWRGAAAVLRGSMPPLFPISYSYPLPSIRPTPAPPRQHHGRALLRAWDPGWLAGLPTSDDAPGMGVEKIGELGLKLRPCPIEISPGFGRN